MNASREEVRLLQPPLGGEAQHGPRALADEGEAQAGRIRFPHDGVQALYEVLEALLGLLARGEQALLFREVFDDQEQPGVFLLLDADARDGHPHGPRLAAMRKVEVKEEIALRRARLHHLAGAPHQPLRAHEIIEPASQRLVAPEEEGLKEGAVRREHAQVFGQHEKSGGYRGHDLLRVALEVEDGALMLDLIAEEGRALSLAPEAEEEAGEGEREEARREAGELARLVEVRKGFLAIYFDHEPPARLHDPAHRREGGRSAVVEDFTESVAPRRRTLRHGHQRLQGTIDGRPARGVALERRGVGWLPAVHAEEQRLARAGGHGVVGEERQEPGLRTHEERDHPHGRAGGIGATVREDGHAHHEKLVRALLHEIHVHGPPLRRRDRGLAVLTSYVGGPCGAREDLPLRVHERDADVAVGGGDAVELRHDLTTDVDPAATVEHERAYSGRGGEHIRISAPSLEPVGEEARATLGDGSDASLPLGKGGLPLAFDLEPDERRDEGRAEEERPEIAPREALAGRSVRGAGRARLRGGTRRTG